MNNTIKFLVKRNKNKRRIDVFLTENLKNYTRSYLKKLIEQKKVKLNNLIVTSASTKIKTDDEIIVNLVKIHNHALVPSNIKLNIVYEDNDLVIVDKPKGLVVHPGAGNYDKTLANGLAYKYKQNLSTLNGNLRPGIVHRIDKETSGILVVAKNNLAHSNLGKQFNEHSIKRKYECLTWGVIRPLNGRIETLISRSKKNRKLMAVSDMKGKKAITNYKTLKVFNVKNIPKISLIECELETGRTHQIRVHLNFKGVSLIGDKQYGKNQKVFKKVNSNFLEILNDIKGQILHAKTLEFIHPTKKKLMSFKSEPPSDFKKLLKLLDNLSG